MPYNPKESRSIPIMLAIAPINKPLHAAQKALPLITILLAEKFLQFG